ncbi:hypothetical protein ACLOJK_013006 [Asimina triloba]
MASSSLLSRSPFLASSSSSYRPKPFALTVRRSSVLLSFPRPLQNPTLWRQSLPSSSKIHARTSIGETSEENSASADGLPVAVGEDSAAFKLGEQKLSSWIYFTGILGAVLVALNVVWIDPSTGAGTAFVDAVEGLFESHEVVMLILILIFATVHSGMANLRDSGEKLVGERAYRVLFAGISLPLAVSTIVYFINHRYDGTQLWDVQGVPGVHELVWFSSFISFFFLYPSTFNLLEVAAVDKPKMHMWETGIMRITRHPQMVGQVIWCLAHMLWIGNSVVAAASFGLIGHHLFGVWNGDRRLASRYGEAFEVVKSRTSIIPLAAIVDGRQKLPKDYYKEFLRLPYLSITQPVFVFTGSHDWETSGYLSSNSHILKQEQWYHEHVREQKAGRTEERIRGSESSRPAQAHHSRWDPPGVPLEAVGQLADFSLTHYVRNRPRRWCLRRCLLPPARSPPPHHIFILASSLRPLSQIMAPSSSSTSSWGVLVSAVVLASSILLPFVPGASAANWCVARSHVSQQQLQTALDYACGAGADCAPIQPDGLCYLPNTIEAHASYAFNSLYQRKGNAPGSCDFADTAAVASTDPSYGSCAYPSSASNGKVCAWRGPHGGYVRRSPPQVSNRTRGYAFVFPFVRLVDARVKMKLKFKGILVIFIL